MGWKKPAVPVNVLFSARTTRGERDALDAVIARWAEERQAEGASASGMTSIAWFRSLIRKLAADQGVTVEEAPPAPPAKPKPARRAPVTGARRRPR
jgi:hypothetical protein